MEIIIGILRASLEIFLETAVYLLLGFLVAGILRAFLRPASVARHFRDGRITSVIYAALLGIPIPLCSCGVVPAVASLKNQGANNGASLSFLISTPESGADSIALTYSLMDPVMTVLRPISAFITAVVAGLIENFSGDSYKNSQEIIPDLTCPIDGCCDGIGCPPDLHAKHHSLWDKLTSGLHFAFDDLMADLAKWFMIGIVLAGAIAFLTPDNFLEGGRGSGILAYLTMMIIGLPMYVCATMSTPIAAALITKGLSPGAALIFLLVGPATNMATISMVWGILGGRTLFIYLLSIIGCSLVLAFGADAIYAGFGISAQAVAGASAKEIFPLWFELLCAIGLGLMIVRVALRIWLIPKLIGARPTQACAAPGESAPPNDGARVEKPT